MKSSNAKAASKREPGVNEITRIAHQAGEHIRQMEQKSQSSKSQLGSHDPMRSLFGAPPRQLA